MYNTSSQTATTTKFNTQKISQSIENQLHLIKEKEENRTISKVPYLEDTRNIKQISQQSNDKTSQTFANFNL